jgi:addiction module RelB/DinJ family antitoxin
MLELGVRRKNQKALDKYTKVYTMVYMMTTTMLFKLDKDLKDNAQLVAERVGIPLSTLIRAYLKEITSTGKIEFLATETMTPQMTRVIKQAESEIKAGKTYGPFVSSTEAVKFLNKNQ